MVTAIRKPEHPATRKQLWYLHVLTGQDTRDWNMTVQQAHEIIQSLKSQEPPEHEMRLVQLAEELAGLKETLKCDPIANKQIYIGQSKYGKPIYRPLTFFVSLRDRNFPCYFTHKMASHLLGRPVNGFYQHGKVPRDVALDELSKEFDMLPDDIAEHVEHLVAVKRHMRQIESELEA